MTNVILLYGPPGSGKSTQGKLLEEKTNYKFLSLGDLFRESKDPRIQEQLKTEVLFSDEEAFTLLKENVLQYENVIVDGFPRNVNQLHLLEDDSFNIRNVFCFDISSEVAAIRMLNRGRNQDTNEVVERRLSNYYETESLMRDTFLRTFGSCCIIDANQDVKTIFGNLGKYLSF